MFSKCFIFLCFLTILKEMLRFLLYAFLDFSFRKIFRSLDLSIIAFRKPFVAKFGWFAQICFLVFNYAFSWSCHLIGVEIVILHFGNSFCIYVLRLRILSKISLDVLSKASFVPVCKMM